MWIKEILARKRDCMFNNITVLFSCLHLNLLTFQQALQNNRLNKLTKDMQKNVLIRQMNALIVIIPITIFLQSLIKNNECVVLINEYKSTFL